MSLLNPLALALSALSIPIVLMYVLKLRRRERVVSSTVLWQRALDDLQANAPWQRLRPNLLLLLQLLALAALVLALAQPAYTRARTFAGDLVLIVDESYGMQAHDVSPSRFTLAVKQAHSLASDHGSGNVVSIIGMGAQPQLKIAASSDSGAVSSAIDSLRVGVSPPNFLGAISLAASLARSGESTRVVVLTSRESGIMTIPISVPFSTEIVRIGAQLHDLAITTFSATPTGGTTSAIARVGNFGALPESSDLELYVDGQLADVRPLTIDPGGVQNLFWKNLPAHARQLRATLTHADDVSGDKSAWTVVSPGSIRHVLLVTAGNFFLQTALALDPSVTLSSVRPDGYDVSRARNYDLVVFDSVLPPALPPTATLLVSPGTGSSSGITVGPYVTAGTVAPAPGLTGGTFASLLRYVELGDVHVARARAPTLPGWLLPIVVSGHSPILAAGDRGNTHVALIAFSLAESDWPLRISFPILVQNLLRYLVPGLALGAADTIAGAPVQLYPAPGTRQLAITRPDGSVTHLASPFPPFTDTAQPGLYTARTSGGPTSDTASFAVNFFPARPAPATGSDHVWLGGAKPGNPHAISVPASLAWACMLVVLLLLSAEWWFAFRR